MSTWFDALSPTVQVASVSGICAVLGAFTGAGATLLTSLITSWAADKRLKLDNRVRTHAAIRDAYAAWIDAFWEIGRERDSYYESFKHELRGAPSDKSQRDLNSKGIEEAQRRLFRACATLLLLETDSTMAASMFQLSQPILPLQGIGRVEMQIFAETGYPAKAEANAKQMHALIQVIRERYKP